MVQVARLAITRPFVHVVPEAVAKGPAIVIAGVLNVTETPVLLVSVILVLPLDSPTGVVAKAMEFGLNDTLLVPVPVNPTIWGVEGSLSLITTDDLFVPVDVGLKVRLMVQLAPPASVVPEAGQVLVEMV